MVAGYYEAAGTFSVLTISSPPETIRHRNSVSIKLLNSFIKEFSKVGVLEFQELAKRV